MGDQLIVVVDGPAGAGKTTAVKIAADRLQLLHLSTGLVHRANTAYMLANKIPCRLCPELLSHLESLQIVIDTSNGLTVHVNGCDMTKDMTSTTVSTWVSRYASIPQVAKALTAIFRTWVQGKRVIVEGRGLGNGILPMADMKIYMDCDLNARASRIFALRKDAGDRVTLDAIKEQLKQRDSLDKNRKVNPLVRLPDAIYIDTTDCTIDRAADLLCDAVKNTGDSHG